MFLAQRRWFRSLPRNLSNARFFFALPSQHPVSVSEPQNDVGPKSNKFEKASSAPSSLKEPELAKFSAIADTWSEKNFGIISVLFNKDFEMLYDVAFFFFELFYYVQVGFWRTI